VGRRQAVEAAYRILHQAHPGSAATSPAEFVGGRSFGKKIVGAGVGAHRERPRKYERNKANVPAFYDPMFKECRPTEAIERYAGATYAQHDPHVGDGKRRSSITSLAWRRSTPASRSNSCWCSPTGTTSYCTATRGGPETTTTRA
jgi:hypothetical protein